MQQKKIVFLASDCESSRWVYNDLIKSFKIEIAIIEQPISKKVLVKRRISRVGITKVLGQIIFSALVVPILRMNAKIRRDFLIKECKFNGTDFPNATTKRIASVNDEDCRILLSQIMPDIVVVNGTRIISKKTLECCDAIFINMHVGITPQYRGSHGGYWALYNKDPQNFGTTIHRVDSGVDTGGVLKQVFTNPSKDDNFTTYPLLQTKIGIEALIVVLEQALENNFTETTHTEKGNLYHQPTVWQYLFNSTK